jgi:hypothetical protein
MNYNEFNNLKFNMKILQIQYENGETLMTMMRWMKMRVEVARSGMVCTLMKLLRTVNGPL